MDWLNHYASAVQAIVAVGTLLLTFALVWATWKYVHLAKHQLEFIREQSIRQRPAFMFEITASVWQINAYCRNVGASNGVLNSIVLSLSVGDTATPLVDRRWDLDEFLQPGKSWARVLQDGRDGKGLIQLPHRGFLDSLFNRPGPRQPSGLLGAEAQFTCGGDSVVLVRKYEVHTNSWGAKLKRLEAGYRRVGV
jgi:hypothetical protein